MYIIKGYNNVQISPPKPYWPYYTQAKNQTFPHEGGMNTNGNDFVGRLLHEGGVPCSQQIVSWCLEARAVLCVMIPQFRRHSGPCGTLSSNPKVPKARLLAFGKTRRCAFVRTNSRDCNLVMLFQKREVKFLVTFDDVTLECHSSRRAPGHADGRMLFARTGCKIARQQSTGVAAASPAQHQAIRQR
jgi:hypothetical protein